MLFYFVIVINILKQIFITVIFSVICFFVLRMLSKWLNEIFKFLITNMADVL